MQNVEMLNEEMLLDVNGGNPIAIAALCVAVFKVGYDIGRDMAKNGW